jgi:hypothetical protein
LPLIRNPYYKSYRTLGLNPNALQINKAAVSSGEIKGSCPLLVCIYLFRYSS